MRTPVVTLTRVANEVTTSHCDVIGLIEEWKREESNIENRLSTSLRSEVNFDDYGMRKVWMFT